MTASETQIGTGPGRVRVAIGRYRIERLIGGGGWGLVYAARHEILGKPVALKTLRPELARDPKHAQRFLREARIAATLHHENIVDITDFGEEGSPYLVMELLRGRTLMNIVRESGPLPWPRVVAILVQLARALGCAHAQGVIHRDIKPCNVMLDDSSGIDRVKLCDFGLSRLSGDDRITTTGAFVGTPAYMAPEQILGTASDARGDLYALGVTGFELLTGSLPYVATNPVALVAEIIGDHRAALRERMPLDVPDALVAVIERCLAVEPAQRPESAVALEHALLAIAAPAPPSGELTGEIVGNYRLTRLLGSGGSGSVWLAEHAVIGTKVAVKVLRPEIAFIPGAAERFVNEARAASLIPSPHIARYLDIGRLPSGQLYAILEYLEGETVFERLGREVRLPVAQAIAIARQVGSALVPAHASGIVHRDVKPENIFLTAVGDDVASKLLDFGIAKMGAGGGSGPKTQLGYFMGTIQYCPPEQVLGEAGPAADVYALGATLFHMLVGHPPFGGDASEIASAKTVRGAPRLRDLRADVPDHIAVLVDEMLARGAAERPSMAEVVERLSLRVSVAAAAPVAVAEIAKRPSAPALPPATPSAVYVIPRSRTAPIAMGIVAASAVIALIIWAPWKSEPAPRELRDDDVGDTTPAKTAPAKATPAHAGSGAAAIAAAGSGAGSNAAPTKSPAPALAPAVAAPTPAPIALHVAPAPAPHSRPRAPAKSSPTTPAPPSFHPQPPSPAAQPTPARPDAPDILIADPFGAH